MEKDKNLPRRHGGTEQKSLFEFKPIGLAIGLKFKQRCFWRRTEEVMFGNMNTLGLLPYTGSFAKLGIGGEPMPGLGKPPFCLPQCLRVSVVSFLCSAVHHNAVFGNTTALMKNARAVSPKHNPLAAAFSLIEVTLAMMVVAIGILSILALFPAGLDQNIRSIDDTHAALFAEEVFGGMRAWAETNWQKLDEFYVPSAASNMWEAASNVHVTVADTVATIEHAGQVYEDHALRYRLLVTNAGNHNVLKGALLKVWPGEFGTTNNPIVFYTKFFRFQP